jgi:hypothetical protein
MICFPNRWLSTSESYRLELDELWAIWRDIESTPGGFCRWCGGQLKNRRQKKFCSQECTDSFYHTFFWQWAVGQALRREHYRCQFCGVGSKASVHLDNRFTILDVHHIIPLGGENRTWHVLNYPSNLIVLCHDCHITIHLKLNELARVLLLPKTLFIDSRQQLMELGVL